MSRGWLGLSIVLLLFAGCALQVPLTGGDKDVTPPQILESDPQNKALNYQGKELYLEFDEFVQVSGAQKELLITPPFEYPVEFKMRGRKVTLVWRDTLLEQTTYLFQFGEGIVDVNEGNPLDSNIFVFSTGDYIDSFYLEGKVIDAFTLSPVKDVWVMLYTENTDSLPYKSLPRYFARTDEAGSYKVQYMTPGDYKVFALQSVNTGYLYDQPDESIAFIEGLFSAKSPSDTLAEPLPELRLFLEEDTLQYLAEYNQISNRGLSFRFNRPVEELDVQEISGQVIAGWDSIWNTTRDSLLFWFPEPWDYDSLHLRVEVDDFTDTLYLRKPTVSRGKGRGKEQEEEKLKVTVKSTAKLKHFNPYGLYTETPIKNIDLTDALLVEASDTMDLSTYTELGDRQLVIDYPWKEGEKYRIFIPDSAITDRYGLTNDTLKYNLIASKAEDFGTFQLNYQLPEEGHSYIIQLQQSDGKVIQEDVVQAAGAITYEYLKTGGYKLKLFFDENSNGKWDTGNYLKGIQPERVAFYDQVIELRSNWITEVDWEYTGEQEVSDEDSGK